MDGEPQLIVHTRKKGAPSTPKKSENAHRSVELARRAPPKRPATTHAAPAPMPRSEKSRRRDRERVRTWRKKNRDRYRANQRRTWKKNKAKYNFQRAERRSRWKKLDGLQEAGADFGELCTTTENQLRRPRLYYVDTNGRIHEETELPAEELIESWKLAFTWKNR